MDEAIINERVYEILETFSRLHKRTLTYQELTDGFKKATGKTILPISWSPHLDRLNKHLHPNFPPLSAIVVSNGKSYPGQGFWGTTPEIPPEPSTPEECERVAKIFQDKVFATTWPSFLP